MKHKQKTRKVAVKRFKVTKTGKILFSHQYMSHLRSGKSRARKRRLKEPGVLNSTLAKKVKRMLGV